MASHEPIEPIDRTNERTNEQTFADDNPRTRSVNPVQAKEPTAEERVELERERDREERDALVERMMDKDKSKTKQVELGGLTPAQVGPRGGKQKGKR